MFWSALVAGVGGLVVLVTELATDRRPLVIAYSLGTLLWLGSVGVRERRALRAGAAGPSDVVPELPESLVAEVDDLLERGRFGRAARLVRERTGLGLSDAGRAVRDRDARRRQAQE